MLRQALEQTGRYNVDDARQRCHLKLHERVAGAGCHGGLLNLLHADQVADAACRRRPPDNTRSLDLHCRNRIDAEAKIRAA